MFRKPDSPSSFYIIYVREGDRVAAILCREAKGKEGGTSGCLTMVKTSRFARSSPASDTATQPAVPSAPSAPPRPAQTGAAAPRPAPVPAPAAPPPAPTGRGIAGCWVYNTINLTIFEDGRITGFLDGGKWSRIGNDRFLFTGPPSTDTLVLSDDGGTLSGSNNYFGPVSAQRSSGSARSVVGAWKWPNGAMTVLSERGEAQNGALSGKWAREHGNAIRIVWNFFFTDDVTLSPDGQSLSGKNMQGTPGGGRRVPCST